MSNEGFPKAANDNDREGYASPIARLRAFVQEAINKGAQPKFFPQGIEDAVLSQDWERYKLGTPAFEGFKVLMEIRDEILSAQSENRAINPDEIEKLINDLA